MPKLSNTARKFSLQPANVAVVNLLARPRGATVDDIVRARGTEPHTVRAMLSRLRSVAKVKISKESSPRRGTVYHAGI